MLSIRCWVLTFLRFFCRIKRYKGKWRSILALLCCTAVVCGGCRRETPTPDSTPTPTDNEMRGVWLSYIELDAMLASGDPEGAIADAMKRCAAEGLNTVFFHVRAHDDAYYPSAVWTPVAAVTEGNVDPLAWAVREAHRQGLTLHAWINPYRIGAKAARQGFCFEKNGVWYRDPGDPDARQSVVDGVREILQNYPVDGIHFDDYFYPTGMAKEGEPFEGIPTGTDVTGWRQTQVDTLVSGVYGLCRQYGKVFGVSPMADHRRCAAEAYANVTRWMQTAGYIDYICPQLYVGFRHESKPFLPLLEEWAALPRRKGVALYIGLALYKVGLKNDPYAGEGAAEWYTDTDIILRQIEATRAKADGYVLFRYGNMMD